MIEAVLADPQTMPATGNRLLHSAVLEIEMSKIGMDVIAVAVEVEGHNRQNPHL